MSRWDNHYSSAILSLAKELAKNNRIFYLDHPFTIKDFFTDYSSPTVQSRLTALLFGKNVYKKPFPELKNFVAVTPRLVLPINWLSPGTFYDRLSYLNDRIIFSAIKKVVDNFSVKKFILFNSFNPFYGRNFFEELKPVLKIYQSRDDISQQRYIARHGIYLEKQMTAGADVVLTTSSELKNALSKVSSHTYHLPNAADIDLFRRAHEQVFDQPKELHGRTGKVVGYTGNVSRSRIDFQLLKEFAEINPDKVLLMVGPLDSEEHKKFGLDKMSNVIFTGSKEISELPAYLQYMDCTLIPFQQNTLTKSIYPLKLNEYLAAGKPVVSTNFSKDLRDFQEVIYLANDGKDFLQMIQKAINENDQDRINKRIKMAEQNTWKARVETFWTIIQKHLPKTGVKMENSVF